MIELITNLTVYTQEGPHKIAAPRLEDEHVDWLGDSTYELRWTRLSVDSSNPKFKFLYGGRMLLAVMVIFDDPVVAASFACAWRDLSLVTPANWTPENLS